MIATRAQWHATLARTLGLIVAVIEDDADECRRARAARRAAS